MSAEKRLKRLAVSKETVVSRRWVSEIRKLGVDKELGQIITVTRLKR